VALPHLLRDCARLDQPAKGLDDDVPQPVVLLVQQDDEPRRLRVERAGDVQDGAVDELLDLGVGHGALLGELVVGAAGLGQLDERVGGSLRHGCCRGGELSGRRGGEGS